MIRVSVMYPYQDGGTFDIEYYCHRHMALVRELLGDAVKGISVDHGVHGPDGPPRYLAIGHVLFESLEAFAAMNQHLPALRADMKNYTTLRPILQISEVKL